MSTVIADEHAKRHYRIFNFILENKKKKQIQWDSITHWKFVKLCCCFFSIMFVYTSNVYLHAIHIEKWKKRKKMTITETRINEEMERRERAVYNSIDNIIRLKNFLQQTNRRWCIRRANHHDSEFFFFSLVSQISLCSTTWNSMKKM